MCALCWWLSSIYDLIYRTQKQAQFPHVCNGFVHVERIIYNDSSIVPSVSLVTVFVRVAFFCNGTGLMEAPLSMPLFAWTLGLTTLWYLIKNAFFSLFFPVKSFFVPSTKMILHFAISGNATMVQNSKNSALNLLLTYSSVQQINLFSSVSAINSFIAIIEYYFWIIEQRISTTQKSRCNWMDFN